MNVDKLFETQKELRGVINYQGSDRFEKLVLALLVEIGECANEWRGFKFWSKNQHPRHIAITDDGRVIKNQKGTPPLLEEFVDGLCFILELGIEIGVDKFTPSKLISFTHDITGGFRSIYRLASDLDYMMLLLNDGDYRVLFNNYLHLGESLGFSWEEIEKAYYEKNRINHERQANGY
ncbi:dUTP diphosphatase [Bacillus sp. MCCB 382]|uniref:dUTP diphosphatase n=1 Tax=Bacillus sp. MCCB 382 TaxID=2860197 RepID=UPI001C5A4B91|nr:dUTP diphosphatase [Bacillus sp. MCCB 382]